MIKGKTILITGGAGFIGSALATRLIEHNRIVAYDHLHRNSLKYKSITRHPNFKLIEADVLDYQRLCEAAREADMVVHCAGVAGIDTVTRSPVTTMRVNIIGSFNALDAAMRSGCCERIVCFSTSEVYGQVAFRSAETDSAIVGKVGEARWTYAVSKLAEEHLAIAYYQEHGLPATVVRPFNVYGPGQVGEGALRTFILRALKNEPIQIHGDGTQIRAWCYIDDMVDALLLTLTSPKAIGESFNIGNQRVVATIYDLAKTVIRELGSTSKINFTSRDQVDVGLRIPSAAKARDLLGFEAQIDLEEGIRRTANYYQEFGE